MKKLQCIMEIDERMKQKLCTLYDCEEEVGAGASFFLSRGGRGVPSARARAPQDDLPKAIQDIDFDPTKPGCSMSVDELYAVISKAMPKQDQSELRAIAESTVKELDSLKYSS